MAEESASMRPAETRRLAAIMFTDIVGFSRQMGADEARMLRLLEVHNQIVQQAVSVHHGHVIKTVGDAVLVDFPSVVNAVQGAQSLQEQLGREEEAQTEAAEVLRLNPQFSLEVHRQRVPIKDPTTLERHIAALRKAGLK